MVIACEWAEEKFLSQDSNSRFFLEYNSESPIHSFFLKKAKNEKKYVDGMAKMEFSHFSKRNAFSINFSVLCWIEQICFFLLLLTNFLEAISVRFNSNLIVTKQKLRDCHKNF